MSAWSYAYMCPNVGKKLKLGAAIRTLPNYELDPDPEVIEVLPDDEGHCEARGKRFSLGVSRIDELSALFENERDLLIMFRNQYIYFSVQSGRCAKNPHVMIGWPSRHFEYLSANQRLRLIEMLGEFAGLCGAKVVVMLVEPPGYFEDRIHVFEDAVIIDSILPDGESIMIDEIWTDGLGVEVDRSHIREIGILKGFARHEVEPRSDNG